MVKLIIWGKEGWIASIPTISSCTQLARTEQNNLNAMHAP